MRYDRFLTALLVILLEGKSVQLGSQVKVLVELSFIVIIQLRWHKPRSILKTVVGNLSSDNDDDNKNINQSINQSINFSFSI